MNSDARACLNNVASGGAGGDGGASSTSTSDSSANNSNSNNYYYYYNCNHNEHANQSNSNERDEGFKQQKQKQPARAIVDNDIKSGAIAAQETEAHREAASYLKLASANQLNEKAINKRSGGKDKLATCATCSFGSHQATVTKLLQTSSAPSLIRCHQHCNQETIARHQAKARGGEQRRCTDQSGTNRHPCTIDHSSCAPITTINAPTNSLIQDTEIESNNPFWRLLSNLTKSITQRTEPPPTKSTSPTSHDCCNLAPEVIGYIASKRQLGKLCANENINQSRQTIGCINMTAATNYDDDTDTRTGAQQHQQLAMSTVKVVGPPGAGAGTGADAGGNGGDTQFNNLTQHHNHQDGHYHHRFIKVLELPAMKGAEQQTNNESDQRLANPKQIKLSIATTTTNTTTTTRSSVSSLSSCILSEATTSSEVRLKWGKKMDFLLSIIGFAVDLANIWRFPYLVYKNGGGVFLIPYLTMLVFGGIPLFFLELCLGQFVKKGPITVWNKICPPMKGVGYCSILISWYVSFYYNVLIAWSVYFIYRSLLSFGGKMPWEDCDNSWNSKGGTCVSISQLKSMCSLKNETLESCRKDMFASVNVTSPASEFFVKELSQIDQSTGLDDMGYLRPELVACTLIVYLLHYFSLFRGLETSGKVVWVTATAPYMILSILLVRGLFLPGASMGIEYYLSPKLEKLADPQVWIDAAGQVFYSIGVGFGVHLTYASFNSHNNNCYRDCLMTSAVNAATSVYSGLVVFVYLGYMATNLGIEIDKVASEGYSLVFEVYPEALTTLPFARFWSILFFIMLLTLGIDSAMGGLEAVITGLEDEFKLVKRLSRGQLTGLVIISSFLPALISCTQGGAYTLFWFDIYSAGVSLLFSALFETIGVVYCYGLDKFILNIESMLGRRPQLFFILCWKYISPVFLGVVIFMSIYTASVPVYRGYTFPLWSIILGWCLAFSSVAAIPIVAIWTWCSNDDKTLNASPGKSPRKRASGADSAVSEGRHCSNVNRKSPSSQHYKSVTVSCNDRNEGLGGGSITTTTILESSPSEHHHYYTTNTTQEARIGEDRL